MQGNNRHVAKPAYEDFADETKLSKPMHSAKMAWHNFIAAFHSACLTLNSHFHSTLSRTLLSVYVFAKQ